MSSMERASGILEQAEKGIGALASDAMADRKYADASALLELARRLSDLRRPMDAGPATAREAPLPVRTQERLQPVKTGVKKKYPKFKRDGEWLIKIGWSKSEGAEYEHKCPKSVVDALARTLERMGPTIGNGTFTTDQVMPLKDDSGAELPEYQFYLSLAWFKHSGLVTQHGRQGYTVSNAATLASRARSMWAELPKG